MRRLDALAAVVAVVAVAFLACSPDPLDDAVPQSGGPVEDRRGGASTGDGEGPVESVLERSGARTPAVYTSPTTTTTTTTTAPERVVPATDAPATTVDLTTTTTAPPATVAGPCGGWRDLIATHFPASQVGKACAVVRCETAGTFDPTIRNPTSTAAGLFQFLTATHKAYGDYPTYPTAADAPPTSQVAAAARLYRARGWQPWVCA